MLLLTISHPIIWSEIKEVNNTPVWERGETSEKGLESKYS